MRVLVAEDDAVARAVLVALMRKWGFDPTSVDDGTAAWEILTGPSAPPIAVLDWEMPGLDGPELCRRLRSRGPECATYLILLTAKVGLDNKVEGFDAGADCYLTKPFDHAELQAQLGAARRIAIRQGELFAEREALRHRSLHDGLTGLLNRAGIHDSLQAIVSDVRRNGGGLGIAMLDLDKFKRINDTWGHATGDDVLVETARRVKASVRPYDPVGRVGGEELLLVVPRCDREGLRRLGERVRAILADTPFRTRATELAVTASIGLAWTDAAHDADRLLSEADRALYRAKHLGRNLVVAFDEMGELPA